LLFTKTVLPTPPCRNRQATEIGRGIEAHRGTSIGGPIDYNRHGRDAEATGRKKTIQSGGVLLKT
jgi:hypothetical protein